MKSLAEQLAARGFAHSGEVAPVVPPVAKPEPKPGKLHIRKEKKGRAGKVVTVVSGLSAAERESTRTPLKKSLGTGASEDGDDLVVQGEHVERVARFFAEKGFRTR